MSTGRSQSLTGAGKTWETLGTGAAGGWLDISAPVSAHIVAGLLHVASLHGMAGAPSSMAASGLQQQGGG